MSACMELRKIRYWYRNLGMKMRVIPLNFMTLGIPLDHEINILYQHCKKGSDHIHRLISHHNFQYIGFLQCHYLELIIVRDAWIKMWLKQRGPTEENSSHT